MNYLRLQNAGADDGGATMSDATDVGISPPVKVNLPRSHQSFLRLRGVDGFCNRRLLLKTALCFHTCLLTIYEIAAEPPYHAKYTKPYPRPHYETLILIACQTQNHTILDRTKLYQTTKSCRSMRLVRHEAIPLAAPMANTHYITIIIIAKNIFSPFL